MNCPSEHEIQQTKEAAAFLAKEYFGGSEFLLLSYTAISVVLVIFVVIGTVKFFKSLKGNKKYENNPKNIQKHRK